MNIGYWGNLVFHLLNMSNVDSFLMRGDDLTLFLITVHGLQIILACTDPVHVSFSGVLHMCISSIMCGKYGCLAVIPPRTTGFSNVLRCLLQNFSEPYRGILIAMCDL